MSRIAWSEYSGADVENLIAYLLCSQYTDARQRKPSRGDQGIDVFRNTAEGLIVWQVKAFAGPLTSSRKVQIKHSWQVLQRHVRRRGLTLLEWHVVRPENATDENEMWLRETVGETSTVVDWMGLANVSALVAKYPAVVDWYIGHDRERLQEEVTTVLRSAAFMHLAEEGKLTEPGNSVESYQSLGRALNRKDPHFYYEVHIERSDVDPSKIPPRPGQVTDVIYRVEDQQVRFCVFARTAAALQERPISGKMIIRVARGSEQERQLQDFLKYGLEVADLPPESFSITLPGGLSEGSSAVNRVTLGPQPIFDPQERDEFVFQVLNAENNVIATVEVEMDPHSSGAAGGEAVARIGRERRSTFTGEQRIDPESDILVNFKIGDLERCHLEDVIKGLSFLSSLRAPNTFRMHVRRQPHPSFDVACEANHGLARTAQLFIDLAKDLIAIRDATGVDVRMSARGQATFERANAIDFARAVIERPKEVQEWITTVINERPMNIPATPALLADIADGDRVSIGGRRPLEIPTDDGVASLGGYAWACPATAHHVLEGEEVVSIDLHCHPYDSLGLELTWLGMEEVPEETFVGAEVRLPHQTESELDA